VVEPDEQKWWETMTVFARNSDHYPHHYVMHFRHAAQIIGYYGPKEVAPVFGTRWDMLYRQLCKIEHLEPESKEALDRRLNADEAAFALMQAANE
jgi:hypothetical protein